MTTAQATSLTRQKDATVAVVLGTRPEIVKLAPVIRRLGSDALVIHTGQHYDAAMSDRFFGEHDLQAPDIVLQAGGATRAKQVAHVVEALDDLFAQREGLRAVVVQGDTNATLAGALAANCRGIPLVHVEAGLRSHDRAMPEEHNRILTDHLSDLLCAARQGNADNLVREGIAPERIAVTGNTVVEAAELQLPSLAVQARTLATHQLVLDGYVLATIHRPENTDDADRLQAILRELADLPLPTVLALHPRTQVAAEQAGLQHLLDRLRVLPPLGSQAFLSLARHAAVLVSDSGGVQEECTVIKRPLVVVRNSTERPESLEEFARLVQPGPEIGASVREILADHAGVLARLEALPSPFGDRTAADRIVRAIDRLAPAPERRHVVGRSA